MVLEAVETLQPARVMGKIILTYCDAKHVIKGFLRIVTQSLCIQTTAEKLFGRLFCPSLNLTVFGGQQEFFP